MIPLIVPVVIGVGAAIWNAFQNNKALPAAGLEAAGIDDGDGWRMTFKGAARYVGAVLVIHGRANDAFLKSATSLFADSDGDFCLARTIQGDGCDFYLPHGAVLGTVGNSLLISARIVVPAPDGAGGTVVGEDRFALTISGRPFSIVRLLDPLLRLAKAVAEADAPLTREEVRHIREFMIDQFKPSPAELDELRLLLKSKEVRADEDAAAMLAYRLPNLDAPTVAAFLASVAAADGQVNQAEAGRMKSILRLMGMSPRDIDDFVSTLGLSDHRQIDECLSILGLTGKPSRDDLANARRRAMRDFHPDRYHAADLPDAVKTMIMRRSAEINSAYETLTKAYGY